MSAPQLTADIHDRIVSAVRAGNFRSVAAAYAGVGTRTLSRWLKRGRLERDGRYAELHSAVRMAEAAAEVRAVAIVQRKMDENWQAALQYLERKFPGRWSRRERAAGESVGSAQRDEQAVAERIVADAKASELACQLLERVARLESPCGDAGAPSNGMRRLPPPTDLGC